MNTKLFKRQRRKKRVRSKVSGNETRPRVSIFRSNKHIFAQLINDRDGKTLVSVSDSEIKKEKDEKKGGLSFRVGELLAEKALKIKVKVAVFDKAGYKYHGRVQKFADGLRKGGIEL